MSPIPDKKGKEIKREKRREKGRLRERKEIKQRCPHNAPKRLLAAMLKNIDILEKMLKI